MAKQQTFGDKLKKKKDTSKFTIKVIKWYKSDTRGSYRTLERFVTLPEATDLEKVDISI